MFGGEHPISNTSLLSQLRGRMETGGTETKVKITPETPWLGSLGPISQHCPAVALLLIKLQAVLHHRDQFLWASSGEKLLWNGTNVEIQMMSQGHIDPLKSSKSPFCIMWLQMYMKKHPQQHAVQRFVGGLELSHNSRSRFMNILKSERAAFVFASTSRPLPPLREDYGVLKWPSNSGCGSGQRSWADWLSEN